MSDGRVRYIVVDAEGELVIPVVRYLKMLDGGGRARNTLRAYAYDLRLFFEFLSQLGLDYRTLTVDSMVGFVIWLKVPADGKAIPIVPMPQARRGGTINRVLTAVAGFYGYLARQDDLAAELNTKLHEELPARSRSFKGFLHHLAAGKTVQAHLLRQRVGKPKIKTLTTEQIGTLIGAVGNSRDRLLIRLLFNSSVRVGEALALWIEDISIVPPKISVCDRGELVNGAEIKTPDSVRTVDVSQELINEIMSFVATAHTSDVETNHIFIKLRGADKGRPLSYPEVNDLFQRLKKKTGIDAHAHLLRHTSATELWRAGWRPEHLQRRLGHRYYQTTYDMYVHPDLEDMRREWEKVEEKMCLPDPPDPETPGGGVPSDQGCSDQGLLGGEVAE